MGEIRNGAQEGENMNMEHEKLKQKYEAFLKTPKGQEWKQEWIARTGSEEDGDFGDYIYDFYPELLS